MSKKGENIYKRKDGRWEARYIKGYHPDGTPKYGYCYGKTYRESKQKVSVAKAALVTGKPAPTVSRKRRFAFYCDEWLKLNRSRVKESTYVKYSGMLEKHIKPRLGGCLVQALYDFFKYNITDIVNTATATPRLVIGATEVFLVSCHTFCGGKV